MIRTATADSQRQRPRRPDRAFRARRFSRWPGFLAIGLMAASVAACGSDDAAGGAAGSDQASEIVVTTGLLGDVVQNTLGDAAVVTTVLPTGADPHDFQPSAQDAAAMRDAEVLVMNGGDFEESLVPTIEAAEADGVPVCVAIDGVEMTLDGQDHADGPDHEGESHDDKGSDAEEHDHGDGVDPHFFTDPSRVSDAAGWLAECITDASERIDPSDVSESSAEYTAELEALDAATESAFAAIPEDRRVLVTNHDVFAYLADRYDFEVVGSVLGSGTLGQANAATIASLAETIGDAGIPAVFSDASSPDDLMQTLAGEAGDVEVVALYSESLGGEGSGAEDYVSMVATNAERISEALT